MEGQNYDKSVVSWDPFVSFIRSTQPNIDWGLAIHENFLYNWLSEFLQTLHCHHQRTTMGEIGNEDMMQIVYAFIDTSRLNKLMSDDNKPSDDLFWQAGLDLLKTHIFPDDESVDSSESPLNLDPIPPHELMRTVMDSYYCKDDDIEMGELSALEAQMPSKRMYRLPTSVAMFSLRTFLLSHALEGAEQSIPDTSESSKNVRWRRLTSMANDALSLFQRMLYEHVGKTVDNFRYGRHPTSLQHYPVEPNHVTSMSAWSYTNIVFPSCHGLLCKILQNDIASSEGNGNGTLSSGVTKTLESCYGCFRMLISILALEVAVVDQEHSRPSRSIKEVLKCIGSQSTNDFFDRVKSAQKVIACKDPIDEADGEGSYTHCPWHSSYFFNGGSSLEEELLLYPSIRKYHDKTDKACTSTFYDELGIAVIAYWKLWAQVTSSSGALHSPYSNSYRWALLFPHIASFLCGSHSSSTMERMDELQFCAWDDHYLIGINFTIISLGFDMLDMLISKTPAIRPTNCTTKTQNLIVHYAYSAQGLQPMIAVLLSHVVRISSLEMSRGNKPPSKFYDPSLKYSSMKVLHMTETLLRFYEPHIQIQTLSSECQRIMTTSQNRILLPKILDFMRPIIMGMCGKIQQYNDGTIALHDMTTMEKISEVLDTFLSEFDIAFADSTAPLPKNIEDFLSFGETYVSVFANIRLQRLWIARCRQVVGGDVTGEAFSRIVKWMDGCLKKLQSFDSNISRLIDLWQEVDDPPNDWQRLFLIRLSLQDALEPSQV